MAIAGLVAMGWGLSLIRSLHWIGLLSIPWLLGVLMVMIRQAGSLNNVTRQIATPLTSRSVILVGICMVTAAVLYPPTTSDTISYRVPRILFWLQEEGVHHIAGPDYRLNIMPAVWELASTPLFQWAGDRLLGTWSLLSWVVCYLLLFSWALGFCGSVGRARQIGFIFGVSALAVMQAGSPHTDLFASTLVLLSLYFVLEFEKSGQGRHIPWAILSLCLASGSKQSFLVLGLPLGLWFIFSPMRPWRAFPWKWLPVWLPLFLLCSPLPTFILNQQADGDWSGMNQTPEMRGKSPFWQLLLGGPMMAWQAIQPPLNPFFSLVGPGLQPIIEQGRALVPKFDLPQKPITLSEAASLGIVLSLLFAAGVIRAWRAGRCSLKSWPMFAALAGVGGLCTALALVVPGALGRTYCGFLFLVFPLAMLGWSMVGARPLRWAVIASLANAMLLLIINPARPLWPAGSIQTMLSRFDATSALAARMTPYVVFRSRAQTGEHLVRTIPREETTFLAIMAPDHPLLPLWRPYAWKRRVVFLDVKATVVDVLANAPNYLIVGGGAEQCYPAVCSYLRSSPVFVEVAKRDYVSKIAVGPETWRLYQRAVPREK